MRSRNVKPGLYVNEALAECSLYARYIFPGLWMMADREGRLEYRPLRIKAALLPYDHVDVAKLLDELELAGFISIYEAGGAKYIYVVNFHKHQNPHAREQASALPPPPCGGGTRHGRATRPVDKPAKHNQGDASPHVANGADHNQGDASPHMATVGKHNQGSAKAMAEHSQGEAKAMSSPADSGFLIPDSLIPDSGFLIPDSLDPAASGGSVSASARAAALAAAGVPEVRPPARTARIRNATDPGPTMLSIQSAIKQAVPMKPKAKA